MKDDLLRNIKLTIEYDGTAYHGWQAQANARTVQSELKKVIEEVVGHETDLTGAGRTDAGVHALGQVANFKTDCIIPVDRIPFALNSLLPHDIVVKKAEEADMDFHSTFSAAGKTYKYLILNSRFPSAFSSSYMLFHPMKLDVGKMQVAAGYYVGTHDFSAFKATGGSAKTTVRTIWKTRVEKNGDVIEFRVSGDGFLYNMVRIMAGTLLYVGIGKLQPDDIPEIINSRDRKRAGKTAPPHGLYLVEVEYQELRVES